MITPMVQALPDDTRAALFQAVSTFDDFDWRNDPHGEHDFGKVEVADAEYFWKIDYYAPCMKRGSEDPSDPACTERVLTIMATCEY